MGRSLNCTVVALRDVRAHCVGSCRGMLRERTRQQRHNETSKGAYLSVGTGNNTTDNPAEWQSNGNLLQQVLKVVHKHGP